MQSVPTVERVVADIVRSFGGTNQQAVMAAAILIEREQGIAANLREFDVAQGLTNGQVDDVLSAAGLSFAPAVDPRIVDAQQRVALAQQQLADAQTQLSSIR